MTRTGISPQDSTEDKQGKETKRPLLSDYFSWCEDEADSLAFILMGHVRVTGSWCWWRRDHFSEWNHDRNGTVGTSPHQKVKLYLRSLLIIKCLFMLQERVFQIRFPWDPVVWYNLKHIRLEGSRSAEGHPLMVFSIGWQRPQTLHPGVGSEDDDLVSRWSASRTHQTETVFGRKTGATRRLVLLECVPPQAECCIV